MINFIVNFLAIIGVIIIISYIISYIYSYFKQKAIQNYIKKINPPLDYMQNSGIKCPDYLSNNNTKNNKYFCSNRNFNIQINNDPKCLNENNVVKFPIIPDGKTWEMGNPDGKVTMTANEKYNFLKENEKGFYSRCEWIKNCGPAKNVKGVWQGIEKICNSPNSDQIPI